VTFETLLVEVADGVGTVTLNRPDVRNALSAALLGELEAVLAALEADPAARVVVLRGAGERAFCAGADLKGVRDRGTTLETRESFGGLPRVLEAMARMRTPLIAQVHGYALAGGCGLAVGCDVVVASEDAVFGLPEIRLGVLPLIVSRVVPRAALAEEVRGLAAKLAGYSPAALGLAKEAAATSVEMDYPGALRYLRELTTLVFLSDDAREGVTAFFEKRAPRWSGR
jgi:enoyl-CoA hydratase/carnithine racemase